ncbi:double-strand break repair protein AddB [Methylocella sp.]|uniref:double-strand break repair protein AddB n=1 Tax=Methylocella sp. TaxID=1978226 RepID=UPI003784371C
MRKTVFTIAPGAPFLKTFAEAFVEGRVVKGFSAALGPLALAQATVYTPTRRAARALADELSRVLPGPAALLPRILPLGALEETETELIFEAGALGLAEDDDPLAPPPAVGAIARRMRLAELILAWSGALRGAIVRVGADGSPECDESEPPLVASSPVDAFALAGELARLIDELANEDVAWGKLDGLAGDHDEYWRVTLNFLDIAITQWPEILGALGLVDRAKRQLALIEAQAQRLRGAGEGPVVAVGVAGVSRAGARLVDAIASAPNGAVVLPGLDLHMSGAAFSAIGRAGQGREFGRGFGQGLECGQSHPQAALVRLLDALKVPREEVVELGAPSPALVAREKFVSQALLPAEATQGWFSWRAGAEAQEVARGLEGVSLIEAADEREEALALALAMRETLERPGATAALVTPDRELARRVGAELMRWGVRVDDSGGAPLGASEAGLLARHAGACVASRLSAQSVAALIAHRAVSLGLGAQEARRRAPLLEIAVLRSPGGALLADPAAAIAAAESFAAGPRAHPARRAVLPVEGEALRDFLERLNRALAPMLALDGEHDLAAWAGAHEAAVAALRAPDEARGEDETLGDDDAALLALFDELRLAATARMTFSAESYLRFFANVAGETRLAAAGRTHPRLKILGLIEARLMDADVMLLGGLDEAVWPPQARADCFLNRPMRAELGLSPPERRLGQAAHDFTQALGRREVVLSRAAKRAGAPTVASRFVQRLAALGGARWDACRERGGRLLRLARLIDRPHDASSCAPPAPVQPQPRPPLELRPTALSVTRIETLRRDPYAIYAEKILRLVPLEPVGLGFTRADLGSAIHAAIERFSREAGAGPLPTRARARVEELIEEELGAQLEDAEFRALVAPRLARMIDVYLAFEADRRKGLKDLFVEASGALELRLADGSPFRLTARADRLELRADGGLAVVDFKTGALPGVREMRVGFAPQLTLEAAMARRGGFGTVCAGEVEALYVKLGGRGGGEVREHKVFKDDKGGPPESLEEVCERHLDSLVGMLSQFRDPQTPYPPRPFPKFEARYGVYDHLARVREWAAAGAEEEA